MLKNEDNRSTSEGRLYPPQAKFRIPLDESGALMIMRNHSNIYNMTDMPDPFSNYFDVRSFVTLHYCGTNSVIELTPNYIARLCLVCIICHVRM